MKKRKLITKKELKELSSDIIVLSIIFGAYFTIINYIYN